MTRRLLVLFLLLGLSGEACAQGSLTIPNTFAGKALGPLGALDQNWSAIAAYVNGMLLVGPLANRPTAGKPTRLYVATDQNGGTTYVDTGTQWVQIAANAAGGSLALYNSLTAPVSPSIGFTFWLDPNLNALRSWNGANWVQQQGGIAVNIADYGAKANTKTVTDGAITSGLAVLTSATAAFVAGDVGKQITVLGAGAAGAMLSTTIAGYTSPTTVTLTAAAGSTVTGKQVRWGTDDTAAFNAALAVLNTNQGGVLFMPRGTYWLQSQPTALPNQIIMRGTGLTSTVLYCNFDTDCLTTASPVNGSTAIFNRYEDFAVLTDRTTHTGGGIADTAGTFLDFYRVQISGPFKYGLILDQSEIVTVRYADFEIGATNSLCGIWLVSGAERTVGASPYFTNVILVEGSQFNTGSTTATGICDDGGTNHTFIGNNFNVGVNAIWMSGVRGLTLLNNASEGHSASPFTFDKVTGQGAIAKRPNSGGLVSGNVVSDVAVNHYVLNYIDGVNFVGNQSQGYTSTMFNINSAFGNEIGGNAKVIRDTGRTAGGFFTVSLNGAAMNSITQQMQTYVAASHAGGAQTVTPATMGLTATSAALPESFAVGDVLFVENNDETNQEFVTVTATTGTTFTATFGSSKSANWLVYGMTRNQKFLGLAVGAPTGGGKGDGTINLAAVTPLYVGGNPVFSTGTPTCGTGCATIVTNSMDSWGAMTTSAVTSAAVSWSHTLNRAPFCTVSDNSTTQFSDVSAVSTTGLTVTFAAAFTGTIYWTCGGAG